MSPTPVMAEEAGLAETRVRFLSADPVRSSDVRGAILASWWRSRELHVAADHIELPYIGDPDLETPLTRAAEPVLRHLREQLAGQPLSILLTDPTGLVLVRLTADTDLERHLDRVQLAAGFSYGEEFVGTNGIGTALAGGGPMYVFGHEHYAEDLEDLACAGVPIRHPVSGRTVGLLDLTCWRRDAGPLLITLAKTTAEQIRQGLLTDTGMAQMELLQAYLRACRRTSGAVVAVDNEMVMMNEAARTTLDPADQAALLRYTTEALAERRTAATLELPTGLTVRVQTRPVRGDGRVGGGVASVRMVESSRVASSGQPDAAPSMLLPGLVGSGASWRRAAEQMQTVCRSGEWLVVEGEPGVGKLALVRAVHQRLRPGGRFCVLDAAEARDDRWLTAARRALAEEDGTIVVRHPELLDAAALRSLTATVQQTAQRQRAWLVVVVPSGVKSRELAGLLRHCPSTIEVPPLRHHIEDVQQLVPFFLRRLGYGGQLTCSPEAMQVLLRAAWPGNVAHVLQALGRVVQHRRTGVIQAGDLPPETRTVSRRLLSPLESLERDAIVRSLTDVGGNKARAARALGMSRATIYRKIRQYGVVTLGP
jgi:transcriptional regulator of acetoin/glycerol metabolism